MLRSTSRYQPLARKWILLYGSICISLFMDGRYYKECNIYSCGCINMINPLTLRAIVGLTCTAPQWATIVLMHRKFATRQISRMWTHSVPRSPQVILTFSNSVYIDRSTLSCEGRMQYLLPLQVSRYCLSPLQSSRPTDIIKKTVDLAERANQDMYDDFKLKTRAPTLTIFAPLIKVNNGLKVKG